MSPLTDDERTPVTVVEEEAEPPRSPTRQRVGTSALLDAIRALPDVIAARLEEGGSGRQEDTGGTPEVTFVGDPIPPEDPSGEPLEETPPPEPVVHRPKFRHPSKKRVRTEAIV